MNDVGKEIMIEYLESYFKHEKIKIAVQKSDYLKAMNCEILLCDDYKVLHTQDSDHLSIHYNGSMVPVAMKKIHS